MFGSVNVTFEHDTLPASGESGAHSPRPFGSNYIRFPADPAARDGVFRFDGLAGMQWGVSILTRDPETRRYTIDRRILDETRSSVEIPLPDWNRADDRVAVISNLSFNVVLGGPVGTYRYAIESAPAVSHHGGGGCGTVGGDAGRGVAWALLALVSAGARAISPTRRLRAGDRRAPNGITTSLFGAQAPQGPWSPAGRLTSASACA